MTSKPVLSFSFGKKAEPKRAPVPVQPPKVDDREVITSVDAGEVKTLITKESQELVIPCKNPLNDRVPAKAKESKSATKPLAIEEQQGGLITRNIDKLSAEDAEAARELLKDANKAGNDDEDDLKKLQPILMKEGSKRARTEEAPAASKEQFDNVSVESFGKAMLLGMGYNPSQHSTKPVFRDKIRDSNLGLGAKALLPHEKVPPPRKKGSFADAKSSSQAEAGTSVADTPTPLGAEAAQASSAAPDRTTAKTAAAEEADAVRRRPQSGPSADNPDRKKARVEEDQLTEDKSWPSRGLVVRLIGGGSDLKRFFGLEAVVLEAQISAKECRCRIKVRTADGESHKLSDIRSSELETRVSRDCDKVRVVQGSHKGEVCKLLKRDSQRNAAIVRIEGHEVKLSLDHVCQFVA